MAFEESSNTRQQKPSRPWKKKAFLKLSISPVTKVYPSNAIKVGVLYLKTEGQSNLYYIAFNTFLGFFYSVWSQLLWQRKILRKECSCSGSWANIRLVEFAAWRWGICCCPSSKLDLPSQRIQSYTNSLFKDQRTLSQNWRRVGICDPKSPSRLT